MVTTLITAAITVIPSVFAIWFAREQLRYERQKDDAIGLNVTYVHSCDFHSDENSYKEMQLAIRNDGLTTFRELRCALMFGELAEEIGGPHTLNPGEKLGPTYILIREEEFDSSYLHVSWITTPRSTAHENIQPQAIRFPSNEGPYEKWKWHRFPKIHLVRKKPIGRWVPSESEEYSNREMPGWPFTSRGKTHRWGQRSKMLDL
ncbi:hypothetical protein [Corynebacterium pygosceleis]|uniref:hypothetical protein n=1 Tax=Corynebacterium pygosceleis TaxID=2800406 RepID=UPI0020037683|nr:hypothetical protein [Corynebacterium pygosceleis]MCK7676396.1 hypothetical protein [Corynebacterium pygosceleis]